MGIRQLPRFAHMAVYYSGAKLAARAMVVEPTAKPHTMVLKCDHCGAPLSPPETGDRVKCRYCDSVNVVWREGSRDAATKTKSGRTDPPDSKQILMRIADRQLKLNEDLRAIRDMLPKTDGAVYGEPKKFTWTNKPGLG
jgi:LSD1 subclass zinc finger protein